MKKAFELFKDNFIKIFILSLMILLPVTIVQEVLLLPFVPELPQDASEEMIASYYEDPRVLYALLGFLLLSMFTLLYRIGTIKLSFESLESRKIGINEIMDFSMRIWPKVMLTTILFAVFVAFGLMLFFLPGIVMCIMYFFYLHIVVLLEIWGRSTFAISSFYTKKIFSKTLAVIALWVVLQMMFNFAASVVKSAIPDEMISNIAAAGILFVGQICATYTDILAAVFVKETKLDIDISIFKKKKTNNNA